MMNAHTFFFCRSVTRNRLIVMYAAAFMLDTDTQDRNTSLPPLYQSGKSLANPDGGVSELT